MIPYARQSINDEDIRVVVDVLQSDWLTQGPAVERFEQAVAKYCGAAHAVAVNSATSALQLAYLALGLGKDDIVWTSPNTFVATANAALHCGAQVDFVDVDPRTYNLSVDLLEARLREAEQTGKLPKLVVPVHFAGQPCDLAPISELGTRYGFRVVEDASHAIGAYYDGTKLGNCRYSDVTVFSFHAVKLITTGEGGMALTNRPEVAAAIRRLRSHGVVRERDRLIEPDPGPWYYEQQELGFNYRMTDFQAALGASQLGRLEEFVRKRTELAAWYDREIDGIGVVQPWQDPRMRSAWHLYVVQVDPRRTTRTRRAVFEKLRACGIQVNVHYIPVHLHPYFRGLGFRSGDFPASERYYEHAITLPLYYDLSGRDQQRVVEALREALA